MLKLLIHESNQKLKDFRESRDDISYSKEMNKLNKLVMLRRELGDLVNVCHDSQYAKCIERILGQDGTIEDKDLKNYSGLS